MGDRLLPILKDPLDVSITTLLAALKAAPVDDTGATVRSLDATDHPGSGE